VRFSSAGAYGFLFCTSGFLVCTGVLPVSRVLVRPVFQLKVSVSLSFFALTSKALLFGLL